MDPHAIPETVRVKCDNEQGFYVLNKSDFNPEVHELFEGKVDVEPATPAIDHAAATAAAEVEAKQALEGSVVNTPSWAKS